MLKHGTQSPDTEQESAAGDGAVGTDRTTDSANDSWEAFRTALVDKTLHAFYLLGWVGLPLFAWRSTLVGWSVSSVVVVILVIAGMCFQRFGRHVNTDIKGAVLVSTFFCLAVPGLLNLGLLSNGLLLSATGCLCASLIFSKRTSVKISAASITFLLVTAAGFVSGFLNLSTDAGRFAVSPAAWLTAVCINFFSVLIFVSGIAKFRESLKELLVEVQTQRDVIAHHANHDQLTQLPTLRLATDRLKMALSASARSGQKLALMFIDLDGFKKANDTFGHDAGDHVLKEVARRISGVIREVDTTCRIGGDEFLVIIGAIPDAAVAADCARKIILALSQPIEFEGQPIQIGCSIGIALFPDHATDAAVLRQRADAAMYAVKRSGKNNFAFWNPETAAPS